MTATKQYKIKGEVNMKQIRRGVFETNSSSCHSIAIGKEKVKNMSGSKIYFGSGEYGWENGCEIDTASYLHTALVNTCSPTEYQHNIDRIKTILDKYNVQYEFAPVKFEKHTYGDKTYEYVKFKSDKWAFVDHANECKYFIEAILSDEDLFLRYLFGDSCIYTGNDNSDDEDDMCYCAEKFIWREDGNVPNPNHDEEHYDYFFKGN